MKINKQKFVQLMKEAYSKKLVTEDGEEQGETLVDKSLPVDVTALVKAVNARLQGKAEYQMASQAFLEFTLEWAEEGATLTDLQETCEEIMGEAAGNQLFMALKRASEFRRKQKAGKAAREPGEESGQGQQIKTSQGPKDLQSFMAEIKTELENINNSTLRFNNFISKIIGVMGMQDEDIRKVIGDSVYDLIADNSGKLPLPGTQNEDTFASAVKRNIK